MWKYITFCSYENQTEESETKFKKMCLNFFMFVVIPILMRLQDPLPNVTLVQDIYETSAHWIGVANLEIDNTWDSIIDR